MTAGRDLGGVVVTQVSISMCDIQADGNMKWLSMLGAFTGLKTDLS